MKDSVIFFHGRAYYKSSYLCIKLNTGGKLPLTWYPESFTKVPMSDMNMRADPSRSYPGRTYRFYTGETVYRFGHGLSYSNFTYKFVNPPKGLSLSEHIKTEQHRNLLHLSGNEQEHIHVQDLASCNSLKFSIHISVINNEKFEGSAVVLLFSRVPKISMGAPEKQLIGFDRVHTLSHESVQTSLLIDPCEHLSIVDEKGIRKLPLGDHTLMLENVQHTFSVKI